MSNVSKLTTKLKNYYEKLNKKNLKNVVNFMNTLEMRNIYDVFLEKIDNNYKLNDEEFNLLKICLKIFNSIYNYSGEDTGVSDSDYDALVEYYRANSNDDSFTEKLIDNKNVVNHKYVTLRGTLDKIYKITDEDIVKNKSEKSLDDWVKTSEKRIKDKIGEDIDLYNEDVIVMPKFDGVSVVFECEKDGTLKRALLRGYTDRNETQDVYDKFKDIFIPPITDSKYEYGFKTEVMMTNDDFEEYNEKHNTDYKNSRSIVSSILTSDKVDDRINYLTIIPLRISYFIDGKESKQYLPDQVFNYPYLRCKLSEIDKIHNFAFSHKIVNPGLRCDGAVIRLENEKIQEALGRENHKQKFEVAFKYTEETAYTKVKNVIFSTGRFGRMTPVVLFEKVKMKGNDIEKASLGSYARFKDLGLAKGDVIKISYDIVPYASFDLNDPKCKKSGNEKIEPPMVCLDCGCHFEESENGTFYYCPNKDCPSKLKGKILNYCEKMGIDDISYATIDDLYNYGYLNSIIDLYNLKDYRDELIKLPGYKERKIDNILKNIESKRTVVPSVLFGSIGIEGFSIKKFENVFSVFFIKDILDIVNHENYDAFILCKGINKKSAPKLLAGIKENMDLIKDLLKILIVKQEPPHDNESFTVVFSKVRDSDMEQYIRENNGKINNSITKATSLVIVPNLGVTSTKIAKAKELGIPIVKISEAKEYIKNNFID